MIAQRQRSPRPAAALRVDRRDRLYTRAVRTRLASQFDEWMAGSPLRHGPYRRYYLGSVAAALGYTMQATVAAWLMATITPSALTVALVQTASTLPSVVFGLVAGSLADIVDRRRVIVFTQYALAAATAALGVAVMLDVVGPAVLLAVTFLIGAAFAFYLPPASAIVNDLVTRAELARAVTLGAVAFNLARAIGPAFAGALVAYAGSGSTLLVAALGFCAMALAMHRQPPTPRPIPGVPEKLLSGILSGLRYARHSAPLRAYIIRNLSFSICASSIWALLPLVARDQLALGAGGYGTLVASFGVGAIVGALSIPRQLRQVSLNRLVDSGVMLCAAATLLLALTDAQPLALIGTFGAGAAWVSVLASLSTGTQSAAPAWVRARAVATNLVTNQASLAFGSILWGAVASATGTRTALLASVAAMVVLQVLNRRVRVAMVDEADVVPGDRLPDLELHDEPLPDDGPVLIQIDYRIDAPLRGDFLRAVHAVEPVRRRNGAVSWRVFRDLEQDGRYVERFIIASWAEYVRLRSRMTAADRRLLDKVDRHQRAGTPIGVSRFIGLDEDEVR
jgi:MFS family permease